MVINIDPNVVYGILVAVVLIVLIVEFPRILRARNKRVPEDLLVEKTTEEVTQQWPRRDDQ